MNCTLHCKHWGGVVNRIDRAGGADCETGPTARVVPRARATGKAEPDPQARLRQTAAESTIAVRQWDYELDGIILGPASWQDVADHLKVAPMQRAVRAMRDQTANVAHIDKATADIRRKMVAKYQVEF